MKKMLKSAIIVTVVLVVLAIATNVFGVLYKCTQDSKRNSETEISEDSTVLLWNDVTDDWSEVVSW